MPYNDFGAEREHGAYRDGNALLNALWHLFDAGIYPEYQRLLKENSEMTAKNYCVWLIFPLEVQQDQAAMERYGMMMNDIARYFLRQGDQGPVRLLSGEAENPVTGWDEGLVRFEQIMKSFDYDAAEDTLRKVLSEMGEFGGPGVDFRRPYVHERLSWLYFLREDAESAELHAHAALQTFERLGASEGVLGCTRRLADIARSRQDQNSHRKWMVRHTNQLIEMGHAEHATSVRRLHGIEPLEGIIPVQKDPGNN